MRMQKEVKLIGLLSRVILMKDVGDAAAKMKQVFVLM